MIKKGEHMIKVERAQLRQEREPGWRKMTNFDDQLYLPHSTVLPPTMYCQERERGSTSSIIQRHE